MKTCQVCVLGSSWSGLAAFEVFCVLGRTFAAALGDGRVLSSYSHCVMDRGRRHQVISRGLSSIFMLSSLKWKIKADPIAKYLPGRLLVVL